MRFTLRQLQYFIAVAEIGTISGAAGRCVVSQTAVSLALADLEKAVGVQLVIRHPAKGVTLTSAGQDFLAGARSLYDQAEELQTTIAHGGISVSGKLTIGCYTTISPIVMPRLIEAFVRQYPAVDLILEENSQPELVRQLRDATLDVAIMYDHGIEPDLRAIALARTYPHVIVSASHPMAEAPSVSLVELAREPMILFDVSPSREDWSAMMHAFDLEPVVSFRTKSFELARCLVGRNLGYAFLVQKPKVNQTYDNSRVVVKNIVENVAPRRIVAVHSAAIRLPAKTQAFIDHARTTVARLL